MMLQQTHQCILSLASNSVDASQHVPLFTIFTWNSWHWWLCNLFIALPTYLPSASLPKLKKKSTQVVDSHFPVGTTMGAVTGEFPESHSGRIPRKSCIQEQDKRPHEPRERLTGFILCRSLQKVHNNILVYKDERPTNLYKKAQNLCKRNTVKNKITDEN